MIRECFIETVICKLSVEGVEGSDEAACADVQVRSFVERRVGCGWGVGVVFGGGVVGG